MTVNGEKLVCGSKKMAHEVFPGAVVMPTLAQNIVRGNFFEAGGGVVFGRGCSAYKL